MADFIQNGGKNGGTYANYFSGILSVWENSYDVASNTSNVGYRLQLKSGSQGRFSGLTANYSVTINGTTVKSGSGTYSSQSYNTTQTICEGTMTISHNNDGSKSISCSSVLDFQSHTYSPGDFTPNGTLTLTTIPRYANLTKLEVKSKTVNSITLSYMTDKPAWLFVNLNNGENWLNGGEPFKSNTTSGEITINYKDRAATKRLDPNTSYKITILCRALSRDSEIDTQKDIQASTYDIARIISVPNVNIGESHTITWSNPSGTSINLKLCKTDNTNIIDYGNVTGINKVITPTASTIYALTPNSNTYTARYILTTAANGQTYTNSKDFNFDVVNSNPTFSNFTYQDTNETITALTGNNQILVNNYSNIKATISTSNKAIAKNSATMKIYKLLIGNKNIVANYNASEDVNMNINQINNNVIDMYAIDSRGNSTKVTKTVTIKNYSNIKIKSFSATRQNNIGTITTIKFEGEFWNDSFGSITNTITSCKYRYKATSSSTWVDGKTTLTYNISDKNITGSLNIQGDAGTDGFDASNSFDIQLILADKLSSASYNIILASRKSSIGYI